MDIYFELSVEIISDIGTNVLNKQICNTCHAHDTWGTDINICEEAML